MTVTCSRSPGNMSEDEDRVCCATVQPAAKEHVSNGGRASLDEGGGG